MDSGNQPPPPPKKSRFIPISKAARRPPTRQVTAVDGQSQETKNPPKHEGAESTNSSKQKDYIEPWDRDGNYPITLPLRRPSAGDPNNLEFGENQSTEPDESCTKHDTELGLCESDEDPKLFFVQIPPGFERLFSAPRNTATEPGPFRIPEGQIAKMRVYKTGKVTWKVGDLEFDAAPGIQNNIPQDLVAIDAKEKTFCKLGKVEKKMIISNDIDSLTNMNWF